MARRGQTTTFEERIGIGERWEAGQTDPEIAAAMGLSVWTVRKWRRKYQQKGGTGLVWRMGRPPAGALGQYPREIRDAVREMRENHTGWGPLTIRTELEDDPRFDSTRLPSRSRIAAFLHQEESTRKYDRYTELPHSKAGDPQRAREEWEMDARGIAQDVGGDRGKEGPGGG